MLFTISSLALASAATRELLDGRASVLVIEGEAGIGKTRFVQRIVDDARTLGATVFSRPRAREAALTGMIRPPRSPSRDASPTTDRGPA